VLIEGGVLEHGRRMGAYLGERLEKLARRQGDGRVVEARGVGMLRALELRGPAAPVVERCRRDGVLVITAGERVLRLAPPLVIEQAEIDEGLAVIEAALSSQTA